MLTFNNKIVLSGDKWIEKPELVLPPATIRLRYASGTTPTFSKGTAVCVDETNNVWDATPSSPTTMGQLCRDHTDLLEVIGGNLTGITSLLLAFSGCSSLERVGKLVNTSSLTWLEQTFDYCTSLKKIELFDTSNVTNVSSTFRHCESLTSLPVFDFRNVDYFMDTFNTCMQLREIKVLTSSKLYGIYGMCDWCTSLIKEPEIVTDNVGTASRAFRHCTSLTKVPAYVMPKVTKLQEYVRDCWNIETGILDAYNQFAALGDQVDDHLRTFYNCGRDTVTGAAELAQIPSSWGGTGA